jgi:hypothetical protein
MPLAISLMRSMCYDLELNSMNSIISPSCKNSFEIIEPIKLVTKPIWISLSVRLILLLRQVVSHPCFVTFSRFLTIRLTIWHDLAAAAALLDHLPKHLFLADFNYDRYNFYIVHLGQVVRLPILCVFTNDQLLLNCFFYCLYCLVWILQLDVDQVIREIMTDARYFCRRK